VLSLPAAVAVWVALPEAAAGLPSCPWPRSS